MKKMLVLAAFLAVLAGCRSLAPVYNIENKTITLSSGITMEQAILKGGSLKKWTMSLVHPGLITGTLYVRGHEIAVNIPYTDTSYSIEYADSENMKYRVKTNRIHPKYNQWVRNLDAAITRAAATTQKATQTFVTSSAAVIQQTGE